MRCHLSETECPSLCTIPDEVDEWLQYGLDYVQLCHNEIHREIRFANSNRMNMFIRDVRCDGTFIGNALLANTHTHTYPLDSLKLNWMLLIIWNKRQPVFENFANGIPFHSDICDFTLNVHECYYVKGFSKNGIRNDWMYKSKIRSNCAYFTKLNREKHSNAYCFYDHIQNQI